MRPIRLGMVGGGQGAFIGPVHRIAARLDGRYAVVAGALSSDPARAAASAAEIGIAPDRAYADWAEMSRAEAAREDGIEAVSIVTPNHLHAGPVRAFLEAGIHVICDKPLTATLEEAEALAQVRPAEGARFLLTHTYAGYPMIRRAQAIVASGALGRIRRIHAEYLQDWLTEDSDAKQAEWRTDLARSGAGAIGDIGTHAYHLLRFVTGLRPEKVSARLHSFVPGRAVDDDATVALRLDGGVFATLWASQVAVGRENDLSLRVYGDRAGLEWRQTDPETLWVTMFGEPSRCLRRGGPGPCADTAPGRVPPGHPEGYLEAFSTLYHDFAGQIDGTGAAAMSLPGLADGLEGMRFISGVVASSRSDGDWQGLAGPGAS